MARNSPNKSRSRRARSVMPLASKGEPRLFWSLPGRFYPHAQRILADASTTSRQIGDQQPGLLILRMPIGTHIGLNWLFLPHDSTSRPAIAWLANESVKARPP